MVLPVNAVFLHADVVIGRGKAAHLIELQRLIQGGDGGLFVLRGMINHLENVRVAVPAVAQGAGRHPVDVRVYFLLKIRVIPQCHKVLALVLRIVKAGRIGTAIVDINFRGSR